MIKRKTLAAIQIGLAALLATAAPLQAQEKLSFSLWQYTEPPIGDFWKSVIAGFEKEYNAKVEIRNTPTSAYYQQLVVELANDASADVIMLGSSTLPEYASTGKLLPLDDMIESKGLRANIVKGGFDGMVLEGETYAMPVAGRSLEMIYNSCQFKEAGVDAPPTNPDEWLAAARKLVQKDSAGNTVRYGASLMNASEDPTFEMLLMWTIAYGGSFAKPDGTWTVNSPEVVKALTFMKTMYDEGLVPRGINEADQRTLFATGRTSMTIDGQWQFPFIQKNNPDNYDCYKSALHPWNGPATGGVNTALAVAKSAANPELAEAFLAYVSRPDVLGTFGDFSPTIPFGVNGLTAKQIADRPYIQPWLDSIGTAVLRSAPGHETQMSEIWPIMADAVTLSLHENVDPKEALDKAQDQLNACCGK